ncbi:MAG: molecular chaperone HtpG [Deltaproteobacteria bacterium]|nr:MAG: molecular chaperone HtpG [Deltaproteobacteria bacterium]
MAEQERVEQGSISIHTENIFPIIKKWLYSEHDIFLRELVSNAVDAISKLKHLNAVEGLGLADEFAVDVRVDEGAGTLTISDNGIGMTADEIRRYINQIAFSSAEEFVSRFKDADDPAELIGHFGLGFYSAFMVADRVEIRSRSYLEDAEGAHWSCDGTTSYELRPFPKSERGTDVVLHLNGESKEFLKADRLRQVLKRYCNFLPVPIRLAGEQVNDCEPLWSRTPGDLKDEDYLEFYRKLYPLSEDPLFWIHLNVDFPFNLKGIIYFPRIGHEFDVTKSHIKLFCNQVFVTDNCPELLPEFLRPLQGCIDAPDLPLNVSRSYLQQEPQVRKIQEVVSGRIAGKIADLARKDRDAFAGIWENIHTFIKYGMMQDDKFCDRLMDHVLYRTTGEGGWTTLTEYLDRAGEKHAGKVFYANDEVAQAQCLRLFRGQGIEVLILDTLIDSHFVQFLEMKRGEVKFVRVDAEIDQALVDSSSENELVTSPDGKSDKERLADFVTRTLEQEKVKVRVDYLRDEQLPGLLVVDERMRRIQDMSRMISGGKDVHALDQATFVVNGASNAGRRVMDLLRAGNTETAELLVRHMFDLACMAHQEFDGARMEAFLERSSRLLGLVGVEGDQGR